MYQYSKVKTRVLRRTLNPVYDEDFTFYGVHFNQLPVRSPDFLDSHWQNCVTWFESGLSLVESLLYQHATNGEFWIWGSRGRWPFYLMVDQDALLRGIEIQESNCIFYYTRPHCILVQLLRSSFETTSGKL